MKISKRKLKSSHLKKISVIPMVKCEHIKLGNLDSTSISRQLLIFFTYLLQRNTKIILYKIICIHVHENYKKKHTWKIVKYYKMNNFIWLWPLKNILPIFFHVLRVFLNYNHCSIIFIVMNTIKKNSVRENTSILEILLESVDMISYLQINIFDWCVSMYF